MNEESPSLCEEKSKLFALDNVIIKGNNQLEMKRSSPFPALPFIHSLSLRQYKVVVNQDQE